MRPTVSVPPIRRRRILTLIALAAITAALLPGSISVANAAPDAPAQIAGTRTVTVKKVAVGGNGIFSIYVDDSHAFDLTTSGGTASHDSLLTADEVHSVAEYPVPSDWFLDGYLLVNGANATCPSSGYTLPTLDAPVGPRIPLLPGALVPADVQPYTVCIRNSRRQLTLTKIAAGGDGTFQESWTALRPLSAAPSVPTTGGSVSISTIGGTGSADVYVPQNQFIFTEETTEPPYWVLDGYIVLSGLHASCPSSGYSLPILFAPVGPRPAPPSSLPNVVPADDQPYTVCVHNTLPPGHSQPPVTFGCPGCLPSPTPTQPPVVPTQTPQPTATQPKPAATPEPPPSAGTLAPSGGNTPKPPNTGGGTSAGDGDANLALAVIAMLTMSTGFGLLALGRRKE